MSRKLILSELVCRARPDVRAGVVGPTAPPAPDALRHLRGLMFDFGGVLYDDSVWRRWLLRLLSHLGLHTHYGSFVHVLEHEYMVDVYRGRESFCTAFTRFLRAAGLSSGQIDEVMAACQGQRRALEESTRPLPGVRCTIARLRRMGLTLGLLSDTELPAAELRARLEQFVPGSTFQAVVSSVDLGCTKPDSCCYRQVLDQMELGPDEVAYVGHDPAELAGARRVGMATIAFNAQPETVADVHLDRFEQLVDVVVPAVSLAAAG